MHLIQIYHTTTTILQIDILEVELRKPLSAKILGLGDFFYLFLLRMQSVTY